MSRFYGEVGYGYTREFETGVFDLEIVKKNYGGDANNISKANVSSDQVNGELTTNTSISVVADPYAYENFSAIRFVKWSGTYWKVTNVDVKRPRLILRLGGVYNGPTE